MTIDEIRAQLKDRRLDVVEHRTGLHRNTLANIRDGRSLEPKADTIARLAAYFEELCATVCK